MNNPISELNDPISELNECPECKTKNLVRLLFDPREFGYIVICERCGLKTRTSFRPIDSIQDWNNQKFKKSDI